MRNRRIIHGKRNTMPRRKQTVNPAVSTALQFTSDKSCLVIPKIGTNCLQNFLNQSIIPTQDWKCACSAHLPEFWCDVMIDGGRKCGKIRIAPLTHPSLKCLDHMNVERETHDLLMRAAEDGLIRLGIPKGGSNGKGIQGPGANG